MRTLSLRYRVPELLLPEDSTENEEYQKTPFLFFRKAKRSLRYLPKALLTVPHTTLLGAKRTGKCPKPVRKESVQLHGWSTLSPVFTRRGRIKCGNHALGQQN